MSVQLEREIKNVLEYYQITFRTRSSGVDPCLCRALDHVQCHLHPSLRHRGLGTGLCLRRRGGYDGCVCHGLGAHDDHTHPLLILIS